MRVRHKMTKEQVAEAMELLNAGVTAESLGIVYGISPSTLRKYIRNAETYGYSFWSATPRA